MAPAQMHTLHNDSEPLLNQILSEDERADSDRALASQRSSVRRSVIAMVSVLGAGSLLAGAAVPRPGALASGTLEPVEYSSASTSGLHQIVSNSTGKCLDWGNVIIRLKECDDASPKELWTYEDGHFQTSDGRCLDMGGKTVHIWQCNAAPGQVGDNQHWKFDEGAAQLRPVVRASDCLAPSYDGAGVSLEPCDADSNDQKWHARAHALPESALKDLSKQPTELEAAARASKSRQQAAGGSGGSSKTIITSLVVGCVLFLALSVGAFFLWTRQRHAEEHQTRTLKVEEERSDLEAAKEAEPEQQPKQAEQPEEEAPVEDAPPPEEAARAEAEEAAPAAVEEAALAGEEEATPAGEEVAAPAVEEGAVPAREEEVAPAAKEEAAPVAEEGVVPAGEEEAPPAAEGPPPVQEEAPQEPQQQAAQQDAEQAAPQDAEQPPPAEADQAAPQNVEQAAPQDASQATPVPKKKGKNCVVS